MRLIYRSAASREVAEIIAYYQGQDPGTDRRFCELLFQAEASIREARRRWPIDRSKARRYRIDPFPYAVVCTVDDERIVVVAVAHTAREPGYWRDRL